MSQGGGGGGGGGRGGGYGRVNDAIAAVTIKQVLDAGGDGDEKNITINGTSVGQVTIVGRITATEMQMTAISIVLDDSTASMNGSYMLPVDDDASSEMAMAKRQRIREGAWVRVVAGIQVVDGKRALALFRIRPVDDMNEVVYHRLDVVKTYLSQTKSKKATGGVVGAMMAGQGGNGMVGGGGDGGIMESLALNPMQKKAYEYLQSKHTNDGPGVSIEDIYRDVQGFPSLQAVKEVMEHLASDGHVFTTMDDNHYSYCQV